MPRTAANPQRPVLGYFAYWIDRLRTADDLPSALADRSVRAAIHEAPPACRPSPVEAWLFDAAAGPGDGIDCAHVVGAGGCGARWATTRASSIPRRRATGTGGWASRPAFPDRAGRGPVARSPETPTRHAHAIHCRVNSNTGRIVAGLTARHPYRVP